MATHYFDVDDAVKHGIDKAVILQNIRFWLDHAKANKSNERDGYYWTYNSAKAFAELFPYMSASKISRLLKELENSGDLIVSNYNKAGYDRTKWYTTADYAISQKCEMDSSDLGNGFNKNEQPIPDSKPDDKPDKKRTVKTDTFKQFFAQYPDHRKGGTDAYAWKKWKDEKLTEDDAGLALAWILKANSIPGWRESKYRLGIAKFIENRIWLTPVEAQQNEISTGNSAPANSRSQSYSHERHQAELEQWKQTMLNGGDGQCGNAMGTNAGDIRREVEPGPWGDTSDGYAISLDDGDWQTEP